jgi:protein tyrosine phosphatase
VVRSDYYVPIIKIVLCIEFNFFSIKSGKTRDIVHCQFLSWPDHGVPRTAGHILNFIDIVRQKQSNYLKELNMTDNKWQGHPNGPPMCVHCSAGIGRTGKKNLMLKIKWGGAHIIESDF